MKTGDSVEILTVKEGTPNRNWLNPNLNYLGSSRSRTKVRHWFNQQNKDANIEAGEGLFHKEVRRLQADDISADMLLERFKLETVDELYEGIGKGQINERQLTNAIQKLIKPEEEHMRPRSRDLLEHDVPLEPGKAMWSVCRN